jgi:hypothetical protein
MNLNGNSSRELDGTVNENSNEDLDRNLKNSSRLKKGNILIREKFYNCWEELPYYTDILNYICHRCGVSAVSGIKNVGKNFRKK